MANCVNPHCRQPINDQFYCCPACGADNRPPEKRQAVAPHSHQYGGFRGRYCVWCGEPFDEPYGFGRKWRLGIAWTLATVGVLLAIATVGIWLATYSTGGFWDLHFGEIAKAKYWSPGRYGHGYYRTRGPQIVALTAVPAFLAISTAVAMFLKQPLTRYSRQPLDDSV